MIAVISGIVLIHEFGHYAAARASGIGVSVFSIGFGPALLRVKARGTEWRLSLVPFGGYVVPDASDETMYFAIHPFRRIVLSAGGPAANFIAAFILIAAFRIGAGDGVTGFIPNAAHVFSSHVQVISDGIASLFSAPGSLSGIVGIVKTGGGIIGSGANILLLTAALSLNLGIFNMLPLPPLDGGKIVLSFFELIDRRASRMQIPFAFAGWGLMLILTAATLILDIKRMIA
jgi:regulator of sigma E protease